MQVNQPEINTCKKHYFRAIEFMENGVIIECVYCGQKALAQYINAVKSENQVADSH